jgi:PAS domain S-box-containing protein
MSSGPGCTGPAEALSSPRATRPGIDFRLLFESLAGERLAVTPELVVVAVSSEFLVRTGVRREEIVGRSLLDLPPDYLDERALRRAQAVIHEHAKGRLDSKGAGENERLAYPVLDQSGALAYIVIGLDNASEHHEWKRFEEAARTGAPVHNEDGGSARRSPAGAEASVDAWRDRSSGVRAADSAWLYATLQSMGEGVIAMDRDGRVRSMNRVAEDLTGFEQSEALGRPAGEILRLMDKRGQAVLNPCDAVLRQQQCIEDRAVSLVRKTGEVIPIIDSASPIRDDEGRIRGTVVVFRDATRQQEAEERLRQVNHELYLFVRSISHDLREPLRMISLYSDMIRHKLTNPDPDVQEYLRYVIGGAERMAALLSDLRAYAEITTPAPRPETPADAELVLQMALANLTAVMEQSGAVVVHDPLPRVQVDKAHLLQLFQNLISNAVKYRREETPMIRIGAVNRGRWWEFSVADNGIGIAPEYWDRVFDFFQRFHPSDISGTGMGLAICQKIVQRYKGAIWLHSVPGIGSTFYFTLPAPAESQPD